MKNRDGYDVEVSPIKSVDLYEEGGCAITRDSPGWGTFGLSASELNGFVPQVGDIVVVYTEGFSKIRGVAIDGRVFRYTTPAQAKADHEQWLKNYRLEKLERYIEHGEKLKERVTKLHPVLQARMARFAAESGVEFWIDSAPYEMACLEGAQALLNKVNSLTTRQYPEGEGDDSVRPLFDEEKIQWINDWWDINSDKHDPPYDYKKQMEIVPDFGDGHSGNTAGAAKSIAVMILSGRGSEL